MFRHWRWLLAVAAVLCSGCTTTSVLLSAAGIATDTSMTWEIVKHVHAKLTEGDDVPCYRLDSVGRALNVRCGPFVAGSLRAADVADSAWQGCVLATAVRDPRLWPAVPELLAKGASARRCATSPLVELAQSPNPPDFASASPEVLAALRGLAEWDDRAIHHDVVRMLSTPQAQVAGLDAVLATWLQRGDLDPGRVAFGPLDALHPAALGGPLSLALEAHGHTARGDLGGYEGTQPRGFELALRTADTRAMDWWLSRAPELSNKVPPVRGSQLPWLPLARVLTPGFLLAPERQADMVRYLMARGADPSQRLPYDAGSSVLHYAATLNSPLLPMLDPASAPPMLATTAGQ